MTPRVDWSIEQALNLRELGGWHTVDGGTIRRGLIYRSAALHRWQCDPRAVLRTLKIRTVFDLRTTLEREAALVRLPDGIDVIPLDVLGDSLDVGRIDASASADLYTEPPQDGDARVRYLAGYRTIVTLPSALGAYHRLYSGLATPECRPALVHCTSGKDRTGWAAAAFLMLLGVSSDNIACDYLMSNDALLPEVSFGVHPDYLQTAIDEMQSVYGSIEGYFSRGLHIDPSIQQALRDAFVERSGT